MNLYRPLLNYIFCAKVYKLILRYKFSTNNFNFRAFLGLFIGPQIKFGLGPDSGFHFWVRIQNHGSFKTLTRPFWGIEARRNC